MHQISFQFHDSASKSSHHFHCGHIHPISVTTFTPVLTTTNTHLAPADWNGCNHIAAWLIISQHSRLSSKAGSKRHLSLRITLHKPVLQTQFVCDVPCSAYFEIVSALCLIFYHDAVSEINPSSSLLQTTQTSHHETHYRCITATKKMSLVWMASVLLVLSCLSTHFKSALFEWQKTSAAKENQSNSVNENVFLT